MIGYAELLREAAKEIKRPLSEYGRDLIDRLLDAADELEQKLAKLEDSHD